MNLGQQFRSEVVTIEPAAPLAEAVSRMASQGVGAVVAVQGRRVAGILTDRDVALALGQGQATTQTPVKDVMTKDVVTIWEDQGIYDATQYFIGRGFRRLPIVNRDNELVGIVTFDDLVSLLAHEMINVTRAVDRSLARKQGG
ncbi:MAG: CBS domain-containing protein [Pirellulales bacterium]